MKEDLLKIKRIIDRKKRIEEKLALVSEEKMIGYSVGNDGMGYFTDQDGIKHTRFVMVEDVKRLKQPLVRGENGELFIFDNGDLSKNDKWYSTYKHLGKLRNIPNLIIAQRNDINFYDLVEMKD